MIANYYDLNVFKKYLKAYKCTATWIPSNFSIDLQIFDYIIL